MKYCRLSVCALSAGAYTATLYVMLIGWEGVGVHPPPSLARADFSIMMGRTPEIGNRLSVCTLWVKLQWKGHTVCIQWDGFFDFFYTYRFGTGTLHNPFKSWISKLWSSFSSIRWDIKILKGLSHETCWVHVDMNGKIETWMSAAAGFKFFKCSSTFKNNNYIFLAVKAKHGCPNIVDGVYNYSIFPCLLVSMQGWEIRQ